MIVFLTSSPCDDQVPEGVDLPCILFEKNGFVEQLRQVWQPGGNCLIVAADPENTELNDQMAKTFWDAFAYHGLTLEDIAILDDRNREDAPGLVAESQIIVLAGGHVPTELEFFREIGLDRLLAAYDGIVMGISAGTMNCAEEVYVQPEEEGESFWITEEKFQPGLGLTWVNVLPHYQKVKDNILDGKRLFEDITYGDSYGRRFFALVDGSYIVVEGEHTTLFGEAYEIADGEIRQICEEEEQIEL